MTAEATNALVAVSIVSIVLNPLLYRLVTPIERWASRRPWLWAIVNPASAVEVHGVSVPQQAADPRYRAVVVGYGPSGRTVTRLLRENGMTPVVVELNMDTVRTLGTDGIAAVYGDVTQRETLEGAGVRSSGTLILTLGGDEQQRRGDPDGA